MYKKFSSLRPIGLNIKSIRYIYYILNIRYTMDTKSTTIRISRETKNKVENLDFVRKDTFDEILIKLIEFYEKNKGKKR